MRFKLKAQVAVEFLLLTSFLFVVLLGFILVAGNQIGDYSNDRQRKLIEDFGLSLKRELDLASVVKDGYIRTIILPEQIENFINYTVATHNSSIIVTAEKYQYSGVIPKATGSLQKGTNIIKKINNTIYIENA